MARRKNELPNAEKRRMNDGSGGVSFSAATRIEGLRTLLML